MLVHRLRRWPNMDPALDHCLLFDCITPDIACFFVHDILIAALNLTFLQTFFNKKTKLGLDSIFIRQYFYVLENCHLNVASLAAVNTVLCWSVVVSRGKRVPNYSKPLGGHTSKQHVERFQMIRAWSGFRRFTVVNTCIRMYWAVRVSIWSWPCACCSNQYQKCEKYCRVRP